MEIGIIGMGQMGSFMAQQLAPHARVVGYDPAWSGSHALAGIECGSLEQAAGCPLLFLFPPIEQMAACCRSIAPHLRPGALVVEGCSVMTLPTQWMRELLPAQVDLIGCHPLFGPQSGANGVRGMKVVLAPVRTSKLAVLTELLHGLGLDVVVMSPEQHDRAMARTQALEQLVARILISLDVREEPVDVPGYRKLVELRRMLQDDAPELYAALHRNNPYAGELVARFREACVVALREAGHTPC